MSTPEAPHGATPPQPPDAMDAIIHYVPVVLPIAGGVLMFLLAFIAIYMA